MEIKRFIDGLPKGACRPMGKGLYFVSPRTPMGEITPEQFDLINSVVQEFNIPGVRITGFQRLQLRGIPEDKVQPVVERLGEVGELCKYIVQGCAGSCGCRFGVQDTREMVLRLEEFVNQFDLPSKLKVGVSGCSMSCGESYVRDVGLVGKKAGWTVLFGGNAGKGVRKGDTLAEDVSLEDALEIIGKALDFYSENAKKKERTARFVERVGIDTVLKAIAK